MKRLSRVPPSIASVRYRWSLVGFMCVFNGLQTNRCHRHLQLNYSGVKSPGALGMVGKCRLGGRAEAGYGTALAHRRPFQGLAIGIEDVNLMDAAFVAAAVG